MIKQCLAEVTAFVWFGFLFPSYCIPSSLLLDLIIRCGVTKNKTQDLLCLLIHILLLAILVGQMGDITLEKSK